MRITIMIAVLLPLVGCSSQSTQKTEKLNEILTQTRWKYDADAMLKILAVKNQDGKIEQRMKRNITQMEGGQFIFNPDGRLQILLPKINIRGDWSVGEGILNIKIDGSVNVPHPILNYQKDRIELDIDPDKSSFPRVFVPAQI